MAELLTWNCVVPNFVNICTHTHIHAKVRNVDFCRFWSRTTLDIKLSEHSCVCAKGRTTQLKSCAKAPVIRSTAQLVETGTPLSRARVSRWSAKHNSRWRAGRCLCFFRCHKLTGHLNTRRVRHVVFPIAGVAQVFMDLAIQQMQHRWPGRRGNRNARVRVHGRTSLRGRGVREVYSRVNGLPQFDDIAFLDGLAH